MADYQINVGVQVEDSQLNSLENKIKDLQNTPDIKLGVDVQQGNLKKSIESVLTKVNKDYKKKYKGSLTESIVGTADKVKTSADGYKDLGKALKSINSLADKEFNLRINIPDGVKNNLNNLHQKLLAIKETAQSMGSIKLKVSDDLKMENGKIDVSPADGKAAPKSINKNIKKLISGIKEGARVEGDLRKQLYSSTDSVFKNDLEKKIKTIQKERDEAFKKLNAMEDFSGTDRISTEEYVRAKTTVDDYSKSLDKLNKKKEQFNHNSSIYGTGDVPPLNQKLSKGYSERLSRYNSLVNEIGRLNESLPYLSGTELTKTKTMMDAYIDEANKNAKYLSNPNQFILKEDSRFSKSKYLGIDADSGDVYRSMESMATELAKGSKYTTSYNDATRKMTATIERNNGLTEKYQIRYNKESGIQEASISSIDKHTKPLSSYFSELGTKFKSLSQYLVSNFGFDVLQAGLASGINSIKELDSAMTELKKTSNGTKEEYRSFTKQANTDAKDIGSTTTQITNSAADWSRLGYSLKDSSIMAKQTGILKNVSEFETIEEATSAMVGIMQAYKINPNEADIVVDKLNKIGNTQPISTSGLASALQIAGSALEVQGNSMEESMAIITAMNSSVQDPNQAARAARTVAMRLSGVSSETLQAEGEDVEGLIESVPKLESKIKSLTAVNGEMGVSLTDSVGNFRSTYDILLDIADKWEEIKEADAKDGKNRANDLLETMAGKNRANALASLLNSPDMLKNVYIDATENSIGSAQNELNTWLDSVEAKTNKVKESWSQLWQSDETTNVMKGALSLTEGILNTVNKIGPGKTASGIAGAAIGQLFDWGRINYQFIL